MKRISTKTTAEAALRELPSVLGAYVSEDLEGHPREIHLLVRDGPDPANLARDIRGLLEERLGIPVDQRVISIAQLAGDSELEGDESGEEQVGPTGGGAGASAAAPAGKAAGPTAADTRPVFAGIESTTTSGQVTVGVRLEWQGRDSQGTADAVDTHQGRTRAAATATLRSAADAPWTRDLDLELDFASIVKALDGEYVLVSVHAMSSRLGRRPVALVAAHPVDNDLESAAALATLKAINRVLSLALSHD